MTENVPTEQDSTYQVKFICFYPQIQEQFNLSANETLLFGFINFYLTYSSSKFYFGNEKLAKMLRVSGKTISRSISRLVKLQIINVFQKTTITGRLYRYVSIHPNFVFDSEDIFVHTPQTNCLPPETNCPYIYNNISTNKTINYKTINNKQVTSNNKQFIVNKDLEPNTLHLGTNKHLITQEEIDWLNNLDLKTVLELSTKINCNEDQVRDFAVEVAENCQIKAYKYSNFKLVLTVWLRKKYGNRPSKFENRKKEAEEIRRDYPGIVFGKGHDLYGL